ncbi:DUF3010 family protein [Nitratidesulfovibrio vulgaris]|uniref:DUF3010 family protein n=1 Tax=Nitratidesulfovibrio vulgaris TaxID=881 RepID=UPI0023011BC3|nr:DUF3010 family protein [Nitratidesulfovibrio vulgaris]WCB45191.1 DUF3010 family protein [Nitratidesulfovibrio vulgaris]
MNVLGVLPTSKDVTWVLLSGTKKQPSILPCEFQRHRFPRGAEDENVLSGVRDVFANLLRDHEIDLVRILAPKNNRFASNSRIRLKVEGVIQLVCFDASVRVASGEYRLEAAEKGFQKDTGGDVLSILNGGKQFSPVSIKDAVLVAWGGMQ